ncbi:cupin domain-containing protein [Bacillus salacetis]|uniref:cupin domain-containing protein n=1 Tax=Bacillus salacetis TaxID=2315464 RepID=UPI003B9F980F
MYEFSPYELEEANQTLDQETGDELLYAIKKNAEVTELYRNLILQAPNQTHQSILFDALRNKEFQLNQFAALYVNLTGIEPEYEFEEIPFGSYQEGLERAFHAEFENSEGYRNSFSVIHHPVIQNAIFQAFASQRDNALRINSLRSVLPERIQDYGGNPYVVDIEKVTKENETFRTALWTGEHLQVTLMSIDVGDDIGLEIHPTTDQFIRLESGQGLVEMGDAKDNLTFKQKAFADYAIMIPAGTWHNITNTGNTPMKVYAIYAPPEHPYGTVHETKADALAAEK